MYINFAKIINKLISPLNIKVIRPSKYGIYPSEASKRDIEIINHIIKPKKTDEALTMVGVNRLWAVIQSVKYIVENDIEGDFVECGVWRGGCSLAMAMVLDDLKSNKKVFLFDTFAGMTKPTKLDKKFYSNKSSQTLNKFFAYQNEKYVDWCYASIEDVQYQFRNLGLEKKAVFVKGDVLKTLNIKENLPEKVSLLRLDTDWYESTKAELDILYPLLQKDGVLLLDDYGHWQGAKKAVDEFLTENKLLNRSLMWKVDDSGRGLIKK